MKITVEMTSEEFFEFERWRKEKEMYSKELDKSWKRLELFGKKVLWSIEPDAKKTGKCKIADHEHTAELFEMAKELFE